MDEVLAVGVPRENVLVVDGGSDDGTPEVAREKGVRVIFQEGSGKADAIRTGVKIIKTPYVLIMDGDYTYPATHIPELLNRAREGYELVLGSRKILERGSMNPVFKFGNWFITKFVNILYGTKFSDVLTGMYLVKTDVLKEIFYEMLQALSQN